jgi:hypothetical protein
VLRINDRYELARDTHCWELRERRTGTHPDGKPWERLHRTWHANMDQAFNAILDREAGTCEDLEEYKRTLYRVRDDIRAALRHLKITG